MIKLCKHTLLAICLIFTGLSAWADTSDRQVITVQGTASASVPFQKVNIQASVTTSDFSAENAVAANNSKIQAVVNMLGNFGVGPDDITTSQFSFYPKYRWQNNDSVFDGYAVTHAIQVSIKGIDRVGEVLDLMIEAGVSNIGSVQFGTESMPALQQQVLKDAVENAKMQAQALADAAGVSLGKAVQIRVQSQPVSYHRATLSASPETDAVPIMPGEGQVQARVVVDYAIN